MKHNNLKIKAKVFRICLLLRTLLCTVELRINELLFYKIFGITNVKIVKFTDEKKPRYKETLLERLSLDCRKLFAFALVLHYYT